MFSFGGGFGVFVSIGHSDGAIMDKSIYRAKVGVGFILMAFTEFVLGI